MNNLIDTSLTQRIQSISILGSLILIFFVIYLIRHERLKAGYSIIWFFVSLSLIFLSLFSNILFKFANFVGIYYVPAALFLVLSTGLIFLSIHYSVIISKQETQIKHLTQEIALGNITKPKRRYKRNNRK